MYHKSDRMYEPQAILSGLLRKTACSAKEDRTQSRQLLEEGGGASLSGHWRRWVALGAVVGIFLVPLSRRKSYIFRLNLG